MAPLGMGGMRRREKCGGDGGRESAPMSVRARGDEGFRLVSATCGVSSSKNVTMDFASAAVQGRGQTPSASVPPAADVGVKKPGTRPGSRCAAEGSFPVQCAAGLVLGDAGLEEVALFLHVDHFAHPGKGFLPGGTKA